MTAETLREAEYPLTFDLNFYLQHFRAGRGTAEFVNMNSIRTLTGPLDVDAFLSACRAVIRRQDVMRTVAVPAENGDAFLRILPEDALAVEVIDLTDLGETEAAARARQIASDRVWTPFVVDNSLLYRVFLIMLPGSSYVAGIAAHHFLADAISLAILWRDLAEAYRRVRANEPPLPALKKTFRDYLTARIAWDQNWRSAKNAGYWVRQLETLRPESGHSAVRSERTVATRPAIVFSAAERTALVQLARRERVTLFALLLALFVGSLSRFSPEQSPALGIVNDQRNREDYLDIAGFFVNVVPISVDGSGDPSFRELLQRARRACIDVMENAWAPADVSQHIYKMKISLHLMDYVDFAMYAATGFEDLAVGRFELEPPPSSGMTANTFVFVNTADSLTGEAVSQFTELWAHHADVLSGMKKLAAGALANPDAKVSALLD